MIQPTVARLFMADPLAGDTGFLPWFLMCEPQSTVGTRLHANARAHLDCIESFKTRLREILEAPLSVNAETGAL